jgi:glycosyltransferase involved in cell wall biosynthesis
MANQTRQLARLLEESGSRVDVVRVNAPYRPSWVGKLRGVRAGFRLSRLAPELWNAAGSADVFHVMANSGWSFHLFAAPAVWISRARSVPVVLNYRGGLAEEFFSASFRRIAPTLSRVDEIVVPSDFLRSVFEKWGLSATVVPNIVDLDRFRPGATATRRAPNLLVARGLERLYDVETALRAFQIVQRDHSEATLTIAGEGPERGNLENLAEALGVRANVRFVGGVDNAAMPDLLRAATVSINPSRADNMPISILEALASGVPVVSTRVGGVPVLVEDGVTALLVPPGEPEAMALAVLRLLSDVRLYECFRANGLESVKRYGWDHVSNLWSQTYRRVLAASADSSLRERHRARQT